MSDADTPAAGHLGQCGVRGCRETPRHQTYYVPPLDEPEEPYRALCPRHHREWKYDEWGVIHPDRREWPTMSLYDRIQQRLRRAVR